MNKGLIIVLSIVGVSLLLVGCPGIAYHNREVTLRQSVIAQQQKNEVVYDRVWKTISQQAQISSEYADQFRAIYVEIMDQRYSDGQGRLANFVQENSPVYSPQLMQTLMTTVEANRRDFEREQNALVDIKREHDLILQRMPAALYTSMLFGRRPIDISIVTSGRTEEAFETGQDNDVDLFQSEGN